MSGTIVYYVVSPVHVRNAQLLAPELKGWNLRIAYEQESLWLNPGNMSSLPFETVALPPDKIPETLWSGMVRGAVLSTAQPRPTPIRLVGTALERGLPTIALEESNQIALNQGTVNNYVLPVDQVLVASEHERQGMAAAGFPERRFEATGWPFYSGRVGAVAPSQRWARKVALGLDPERPVASLTLTGLYDAGESPAVRRRQLSLAAQGLPPRYQLVVKPHPIEKREVLQPFVDECAPRAVVLEGMVRVEELLEATDVLLNRGVSQVCIEALFQEIPVIVLDTGIQTPFHGLAQGLVIEQPEELGETLERLIQEPEPMGLYAAFRQRHIPFLPREARERTCRRIAEIAERGECDPDSGRQWFDLALYQAWKSGRGDALNMVARQEVGMAGCPGEALTRLIRCCASRADLEELVRFLGDGFQGYVLRCLWIDQLERRRTRPGETDLAWMMDFPPALDAVWFIPHARKWAFMLLRSGQRERVEDFVQRVREQFIHVPNVPELLAEVDLCLHSSLGCSRILLKHRAKSVLRLFRQWAKRLLH